MTATAQPILPAESWDDSIEQPDVIVNDNARRLEVALMAALSFEATQPPSPSNGDLYVLSANWGDEVIGTLAYYLDDAWTYWLPFDGLQKEIGGDPYIYDGGSPDGWFPYTTPGAVNWGSIGGTLADQADLAAELDAIDTRGKQAIYISCLGFTPDLSTGPAAVASLALSADVDIQTMNFDPTSTETAYAAFVMPEKWNGGTITYRVHWSHPSTTTNFGTSWRLYARAMGDDDALDAALGTGVDVSDTGGTTDDLYISDESAAVTVSGSPAGGKLVRLTFRRRPTDAADTLAVDARLHGVTVYVTTDQSTDV